MFDPSVKKGIAIAVALILVFSFGYFIGTTNNIQINHNGAVTEAPQTVAPVAAPTAAPTAAPVPTPHESSTGLGTITALPHFVQLISCPTYWQSMYMLSPQKGQSNSISVSLMLCKAPCTILPLPTIPSLITGSSILIIYFSMTVV